MDRNRENQQKIITELRKLSRFSGTALQVHEYILDHPRMISPLSKNLVSSIYIDPEGIVNLLKPHTHDEIARKVLRNAINIESPQESDGTDEWIHRLKEDAGIIHCQVISDRGIGVSFDLLNPPTLHQIKAIVELNQISDLDGDNFSAYITY